MSYRKDFHSFKRTARQYLSRSLIQLLELIDGHKKTYRLTNAQLAHEMGCCIKHLERLIRQARELGLIQTDGKVRPYRGYKRTLSISPDCLAWMHGEMPSEALLKAFKKSDRPRILEGVRPRILEGVRPRILEGTEEEYPYGKEEEGRRDKPSSPSLLHDFIEVAEGSGLGLHQLEALAKRAIKEDLTLEDWKLCLSMAQEQREKKPHISLGQAIGQLIRCRDFVEAHQKRQIKDLEKRIESNKESLREAVQARTESFRGFREEGNAYVRGSQRLDYTISSEEFRLYLNRI